MFGTLFVYTTLNSDSVLVVFTKCENAGIESFFYFHPKTNDRRSTSDLCAVFDGIGSRSRNYTTDDSKRHCERFVSLLWQIHRKQITPAAYGIIMSGGKDMNNYFMSGKLMHKASDHNTKRCEVEKWVFLPHSDFERLKANPYQEHEAITAARDLMYEDKNAYHCIMLLDEHGDDGLLIEAEGFDYPRLSMFVPDAALIYERYKTSEAELKLHDMIRDTVEKIVELAHTGKTDFTSADMIDMDEVESLVKNAIVQQLSQRDDIISEKVRSAHCIRVWSVQEGEQRFESHVDKLMNYIRFWQASGESEKTSMRIKTRMQQLTAEGSYTGGGVPFGYQLEKRGRLNKSGKEIYDLVINPVEAEWVVEIFEKTVKYGYGSHRLSTY